MKKSLLLLLLLLSVNLSNAQSWTNIPDPANTSWNANHFYSTATIGNDVYIAYQDAGNGNKISVRKLSGSTYSMFSEALTSGGATNIKLKTFNNTLYLAYTDSARNQKMTIMKYNGTSWQLVGNGGFTSAAVVTIDFDFDSNGNIYAVYNDLFYTGKATVSRFNGTSWSVFGQAGFSYDNAQAGLSIAIDRSTDKVYVAAINSTTYTIRTYEYDASNFIFSLHSQLNGTSTGTKIISNSNGKLFLLMQSGQNYQVFKHNGSSWAGVGSLFSPGVSSNSFDIAVYGNDLYMFHAYNSSNTNGLSAFKYTDGTSTSWTQLSTSFGSNENVGAFLYGRIVKTDDNKLYVTGKNDSNLIPYVYKYDTSLGVDDFENGLKVSLYPNPIENILNIELENEIKSVEIYDIQGIKIKSSSQKQLDVSALSQGVYFVRVVDENNLISTKRIIKK